MIYSYDNFIDGEAANILQTANVDFFPDPKCTLDYGADFLKTTMLCAGKREGGIDSCQVKKKQYNVVLLYTY